MSLQLAAQHLASKGRGPDSVLVHMSPNEVRGLQALAQAHGGQLTTNPNTGMPEAGFLDSILPTILGAAVTAFTGIPAWQVGLGVGAVQAARTGDLGKGLMAGLGAYGGAGLGGALAGAGTAMGMEAAQAAAPALTPAQLEEHIARTMLETGVTDRDVILQQLQREATEKAMEDVGRQSFGERAGIGLKALGTEAGRNALMEAAGGGKELLTKAGMAFGPAILAGESVKTKMPQTTTPATAYITPYAFNPYTGGLAALGRWKPEEFPGFGGPTYKGASGGAVALADGGDVMMAPGSTPSYQRTSMSPGMLDFAQRSEPVIRMNRGGIAALADGGTPVNAYFAANPDVAAAYQQNTYGLTPEQFAQTHYEKFGQAEQRAAPTATMLPAPISGPSAIDPTQRATPTLPQLAAQQSIVADPVAAARQAALSGVQAGLSNQQIADMVNAQYGKSFDAANVAQFMQTQGITRPTTLTPGEQYLKANPDVAAAYANRFTDPNLAGTKDMTPDMFALTHYNKFGQGEQRIWPTATKPPAAPTPTLPLYPGTTPGVISYGEPAITQPPAPTTMQQLVDTYTKGGGATRTPTITDILPTDRTYTQNEAFTLLQGYLKSNPNAQYADVVSFARGRGIPEMQARAAYNEFRFSGLTGGSKSAYDYLMGRGAYPVNQVLPGGAPLMRPYLEASGISSASPAFQFVAPSKTTATTTGTTEFKSFTDPGKPPTEDPGSGMEWVWDAINGQWLKKPAYVNANTGGLMAMAGGGMSKLEKLGILGAAAAGGHVDGHLGSYSDGGRLLRGPGDGVSDSIPATIANKQPARLADGEFVVPARIVSELGNGSTEAGARKLYAMMDRVQHARRNSVGKGRVAKDTKADKYLPA